MKAKEAKKEILSKIDELYEIFNQIDHESELAINMTMMRDYKSCALYESESFNEIFSAYTFPGKGINCGWDK